MKKIKLPHILLIAYLIVFLATAFTPYDRAVWRAESLPIMVVVLILVIWYRKFQFSNTAYILMSLWIFMHTVGAYYTFERVPFDWFNNLFGFERNMYDRIAHYIIWFYAYPLAEYVTRKNQVRAPWIVYALAIFAIFTLASVYEIAERIYAVKAGGEQWIAFLWSQGDIRDAQKDMLADWLWAITSMIIFWFQHRKQWQ